MKKELAACFAALCCAAVFTIALAEAKPHLVVYVIGDKAENEKKTLTNELMSSFVRSGQYTAAERSNDFAAALAQGPGKPRVSDARIMEVAKQHGVEHVCVADITSIFGTYYVSLRIVNVETNEVDVISSANSNLKRHDDFTAVSDKMVAAAFTVGQVAAAAKPQPAHVPEPSPPVEIPAEHPIIAEPHPDLSAAAELPVAPPPIMPIPGIQDIDGAHPAGDANYYYNRGYASTMGDDNDGAIANYTEALKLDPKLIYALIARGAAYYSKGDYQSAVDDYSKTLELEPNDAGVFNSRGNAYRKMGNYDMAIADYEAALRIDPNNTEARENLELISLDKSGSGGGQGYGYGYGSEGGEYKPKYRRPFFGIYRDRIRVGFTVVGSYNELTDIPYSYNHGGKYEHYHGEAFRFGIATTVPFASWVMLTAEFAGTYRNIDAHWNSYFLEPEITEYTVNIPVTIRVATPWQGLGLYLESGLQYEYPLVSEISFHESDSKPVNISDRNSELQFVVGGGTFLKLGAKWWWGTRIILPISDFAGNAGWLPQWDFSWSLLF